MKQILNSKYFLNEDNKVVNTKSGLILKVGYSNVGYKQVCLYIDGVRTVQGMHRIVAHCYLGLDLMDGKTHVDHINGIRDDNRLENLRLCTHLENMNFHSKNQLPYYVNRNIHKNCKQGFFYAYNRTINGKLKNLKSSINLDVILEFKKQYELLNN